MAVDRRYIAENNAERARLRALVARLSDADLARPMPGGWTVASVLAHVAYWDERIVALIDAWQRSGLPAAPAPFDEGPHVDWINDAAKPMFLALDPRRAANVTLEIAEAVDRKLEALPDAFVARIEAGGVPINLQRAEHRRVHIEEIEQALRSR